MIIQKCKLFQIIIVLIMFYINTSCAPRVFNHGSVLSKAEINRIKNVKFSKSEIIEILGQPSTKSTFSENTWYYISNVQKERAYFAVKTIENDILKITFDKDQMVSSYNFFSRGKLLDIKVNDTKTLADIDGDKNFWQDFFSSFMRRLEAPSQKN